VHRVAASQPKPTENKSGGPGTAASATSPAAANPPPAPAADKFVLDGVPSGRQAADSQTLAPSPAHFSNLNVEDVVPAGDIDFSKPSTVSVLADGSVITFTGAVIGDKRWIKVAAPKDATLSAKANGRAFEMASYRYDGIFRPLELLLVPKPPPPPPPSAKKPAPAPKP
jgi:hypothetical protein